METDKTINPRQWWRSASWYSGWKGLLPGGITAILALLLLQLGVWQPLEEWGYNALVKLRGGNLWSDQVVVVAIDENSLETLGQFPLAHTYYADLLDALAAAGPNVAVLDVFLTDGQMGDRPLANAIQRHGNVVLAQSWDSSGAILLPSLSLQQAAAAVGHVLQQPDADGVTRQVKPMVQGIANLGISAVKVYHQLPNPVPAVNLGSPLWINWPGPVQQVDQYSLLQVLQGQVPAAAFANKIVVVGVTATVLDSLQTPFNRSPAVSDVYLHAAVISNVLQQNFLTQSGLGWVGLILVLGGPGLSILFTRYRLSQQAIALSCLCIGWGLLSLLLLHQGIWIPVALPMGLLIGTAGAVTLYKQLRTNALLLQSEERYELAVRGSSEGLWDWDLKTDDIYFSPRWKALLGYTEAEINSQPDEWFSRIHPDEQSDLKAAIQAHLNGLTPHFEYEYRICHRDGTYRWMLSRGLMICDGEDRPYRMAGSQSDITERKQAEKQLLHNALYDPLTDLPNRAMFISRLRHKLKRMELSKYPFAVLCLDLDRTQVINESLGHAAGEQLLVAIARRLAACLGPRDFIAHFGGGEFAIMLRKVRNNSAALQLADRIHKALSLPCHLDSSPADSRDPTTTEFFEVFTTASIGIALSSAEYTCPEDLLRDADIAMQHAKATGKGGSAIFEPTMHGYSADLLQLETDLRRAIKRQELRVYYQPIVSLSTGQITGFEALARWQHQEQGLVSPGKFIPVAEETGLITPLGWWILQQACHQLQRWQTQFPSQRPLTVSVNLSGIQFAQPDLIQRIQRTLDDINLDGSSLKLEITESVIMGNASSVTSMMQQLRDLGIQLCIDDFGTGYSSLARLHHLPLNTLKIDRSFISPQSSASPEESWEIVRTIIALAHILGLDVVAEGIETVDQLDQLKQLNCEYGQGYFFSEPIDDREMEAMLASQAISTYTSTPLH